MQLSFNLEDILYLRLFEIGNPSKAVRLALKEKTENEIIAVTNISDSIEINPQQKVSLDIVCHDGLYNTEVLLKEIIQEEEHTKYIMSNPKTLDYQQNRAYYRILADYDCVYTVETDDGNESYNAVVYDISASGVSIVISENVVSMKEMSILIFAPERDIKSHLKFVRCEIHEDNCYKLSFEFMDLAEKDIQYLDKLCTYKQLG